LSLMLAQASLASPMRLNNRRTVPPFHFNAIRRKNGHLKTHVFLIVAVDVTRIQRPSRSAFPMNVRAFAFWCASARIYLPQRGR
jgi:hypothetical protein